MFQPLFRALVGFRIELPVAAVIPLIEANYRE